jgi:hypothetical protein
MIKLFDFLAGVLWCLFAPTGWLCKLCKHPFRTQWKEKSVGLYDQCVVCGTLIKKEKK